MILYMLYIYMLHIYNSCLPGPAVPEKGLWVCSLVSKVEIKMAMIARDKFHKTLSTGSVPYKRGKLLVLITGIHTAGCREDSV